MRVCHSIKHSFTSADGCPRKWESGMAVAECHDKDEVGQRLIPWDFSHHLQSLPHLRHTSRRITIGCCKLLHQVPLVNAKHGRYHQCTTRECPDKAKLEFSPWSPWRNESNKESYTMEFYRVVWELPSKMGNLDLLHIRKRMRGGFSMFLNGLRYILWHLLTVTKTYVQLTRSSWQGWRHSILQ